METHLCNKEHDINEIKEDVKKILKMFHGNGELGFTAKVHTLWENYNEKRKTNSGLMDWAFRGVITIIMGYIAVKIGLK